MTASSTPAAGAQAQAPSSSATKLAHHLADTSLTPLLTSSQTSQSHNESQFHALTTLTSSALLAHNSASRLGLGAPLRIMFEMEDDGAVVLSSFMDSNGEDGERAGKEQDYKNGAFLDIGRLSGIPADIEASAPSLQQPEEEDRMSRVRDAEHGMSGLTLVHSGETGITEESEPSAPMLVGTVVAPSYKQMREARRMVSKLEAVGRSVQEQLLRDAGMREEGQDEGQEGG